MFITADQQETVPAYWGEMRRIGPRSAGGGAFHVRFHPGTEHRLHQHPDHDEIIWVASGTILQTIGSESKLLHRGDSAFIAKGTPHKAKPMIDGTEVIVMLSGASSEYVSVELEADDSRA